MKISNVSFGNVVAVSGKVRKINGINSKLRSKKINGDVLIQDITSKYMNSSAGKFSDEAKKGNCVYIYITGDDISKVKNHDTDYGNVEAIISKMKDYFNLNNTSVQEAIKRIFLIKQ